MNKFAKLFETELGQILILLEAGEDDRPEVNTLFKPKGYGICKIGIAGFKDTDDSWERAEKTFNNITEETAHELVSKLIQELGM